MMSKKMRAAAPATGPSALCSVLSTLSLPLSTPVSLTHIPLYCTPTLPSSLPLSITVTLLQQRHTCPQSNQPTSCLASSAVLLLQKEGTPWQARCGASVPPCESALSLLRAQWCPQMELPNCGLPPQSAEQRRYLGSSGSVAEARQQRLRRAARCSRSWRCRLHPCEARFGRSTERRAAADGTAAQMQPAAGSAPRERAVRRHSRRAACAGRRR